MNDLRALLFAVPLPDEADAERRAWEVVRAAYAEREPLPRPRRLLRPALALAVVAVVAAAALSPPGRAVGDWIRDRVAGEPNAEPALVRLPAPGMLLVTSERGAWVVRGDGSKRLLGAYGGASFSPRGLFVVATAGHRVVATELDGDPRWSLARPGRVGDARWAPTPGFRIAYREGETLRVVDGDGTGDRLLARDVAPVAPAWLPRANRTVLAYARADGVVSRRRRRLRRGALPDAGHPGDQGDPLDARRARCHPHEERARRPPPERRAVRASDGSTRRGARAAGTRSVARPTASSTPTTTPAPGRRRSSRAGCFGGGACRTIGPREIYTGPGHLRDLVLSPDGRWLLAAWPEADQFLFLRLSPPRIKAVDNISASSIPAMPAQDPSRRSPSGAASPRPGLSSGSPSPLRSSSRRSSSGRPAAAADHECPFHALLAVTVDGAVHLVLARLGRVDGEVGRLTRLEVGSLDLLRRALDLERVHDRAGVDDVQRDRSRIERDRRRIERELTEIDLLARARAGVVGGRVIGRLPSAARREEEGNGADEEERTHRSSIRRPGPDGSWHVERTACRPPPEQALARTRETP